MGASPRSTTIAKSMPFPLLGIDSDNGSEFINHHLLAWCEQRKITFTRSRPGNSNDGAHVEQKNWAIVRTVVGYHRYDTEAELLLLNKIWALQSKLTNYFSPQQKLVSKVRDGAKVTKKYDVARPPRTAGPTHTKSVSEAGQGEPRRNLHEHQPGRRPTPDPGPHRRAAHPHHQQGRTAGKPSTQSTLTRASTDESTNQASRAS